MTAKKKTEPGSPDDVTVTFTRDMADALEQFISQTGGGTNMFSCRLMEQIEDRLLGAIGMTRKEVYPTLYPDE